jgi:hypothetical protein
MILTEKIFYEFSDAEKNEIYFCFSRLNKNIRELKKNCEEEVESSQVEKNYSNKFMTKVLHKNLSASN